MAYEKIQVNANSGPVPPFLFQGTDTLKGDGGNPSAFRKLVCCVTSQQNHLINFTF